MVQKIIEAFLCAFCGAAFIVIVYLGSFNVMLRDDIEFRAGKKAARHIWKLSDRGFLEKIFYIGYIDKISRWHYFIFICFAISAPISLILCSIIIIIGDVIVIRYIIYMLLGISILSILISVFTRESLYRGNIVRKRSR